MTHEKRLGRLRVLMAMKKDKKDLTETQIRNILDMYMIERWGLSYSARRDYHECIEVLQE